MIIENRLKIEEKIQELRKERNKLLPLAHEKANTLKDYRKAKAIAITTLRSGKSIMIDKLVVSETSATLIPHIAQGSCWEEKLDSDLAEVLYKSQIVIIHAVMAELNGFQSIHKYED